MDAGTGTPEEAVRAVEARAGFRVALPTELPFDDYSLAYVDLRRPAGADRAGAVSIGYSHATDAASSFVVTQTAAHAFSFPANLPPTDTSRSGASIWWFGETFRLSTEPSVLRMQIWVRSLRFDRTIWFEGTRFPSKEAAFAMIESMLGQDE